MSKLRYDKWNPSGILDLADVPWDEILEWLNGGGNDETTGVLLGDDPTLDRA